MQDSGWQNLFPSMFNKAYMFKTAVSDLLLPDTRFPKDGQVTMIGGRVHRDDERGRIAFEEDIRSFVWFSYRQGFTSLVDEYSSQPITYDTGWGCVHRTGQMLLMATLRKHLAVHQPQHLLRHFRDSPHACFSIQNIASQGMRYGKPPGQWFNSSTIAHVLKDLVAREVKSGRFLQDRPLHVEVVKDQQISCSRVLQSASHGGILLLIPFMLGITSVNKPNEAFLLSCIRCKHGMGVLGGKPRHALYFIGYKCDSLIFLDPHRVQSAYVDDSTRGMLAEPRRRAIACTDIDTCCLLSFYARDIDSAKDLLTWLRNARFEGMSHAIFDVQGYTAVDSTAVEQAPVLPARREPSPTCSMPTTPPDSPGAEENVSLPRASPHSAGRGGDHGAPEADTTQLVPVSKALSAGTSSAADAAAAIGTGSWSVIDESDCDFAAAAARGRHHDPTLPVTLPQPPAM